jgi:hypothetical protein
MRISSAGQPAIVSGRRVGKRTFGPRAQSRRAFVSIPIHQQGSEAMYFGIGGLILLIIILVILFR